MRHRLWPTRAQIVLFGAVRLADQADQRLRAERRLFARLPPERRPRSAIGGGPALRRIALPSARWAACSASCGRVDGRFDVHHRRPVDCLQCLGEAEYPQASLGSC